jgi:CHASE3 domain sensor protein
MGHSQLRRATVAGRTSVRNFLSPRARTSFLNSGDVSNLAPYDAAKSKVHQQLVHIRDLTKDNPVQQSLCTQLEDNVLRRLELLDTSIEMRKSAPLDDATQPSLSRENVNAAAEFMDVMQKMDGEEERLVGLRKSFPATCLALRCSSCWLCLASRFCFCGFTSAYSATNSRGVNVPRKALAA